MEIKKITEYTGLGWGSLIKQLYINICGKIVAKPR